MKGQKEPLYRKVNTKARGCHHNKGSNYRNERGTKNPSEKMKKDVQRGLDYTPLFRFLLSRIGKNWDEVYSEAKSRIDKQEPIHWMVRDTKDEDYFRNENAFFNTLYVDENNTLQKVNASLSVNDFSPDCHCCTHSFNGSPLTNKANYE